MIIAKTLIIKVSDIQKLRCLEKTANGKMGIRCIRSVLTYLNRGDYTNARNVANLEFDKLYQYEHTGLPTLVDNMFQLGKYKRWV